MNLFVSQCVTKKLFLSCSCIDTLRRCILHICLLKKQLSFSALPFVFFFFILLLLTLHVRSLLMSFYDSDRCFPFFEFIRRNSFSYLSYVQRKLLFSLKPMSHNFHRIFLFLFISISLSFKNYWNLINSAIHFYARTNIWNAIWIWIFCN